MIARTEDSFCTITDHLVVRAHAGGAAVGSAPMESSTVRGGFVRVLEV